MTTPLSPDALIARLDDDLAGVGREVARIRASLDGLRSARATTTPPPASAPLARPAPPPAPPLGPPPAPPGWSPPPAGTWAPPRGWPVRRPGPPVPPPAAPRTPRIAWSPARLLAVTGAAMTVLGIVLLLVLAANRGWLGPEARVLAGAALGLVLAGIGVRVRERAVDGAVALVVTGVAALFLADAAAVSLYAFLPVAVAVPIALLVTAGGFLLADRWRHEGLALGVLVASALAAPLVVGALTPTLVALLLGAQVGAVVVARRRAWPRVATVAAVASTVAALGAAVRLLAGGADVIDADLPTTLAVVAVLVAGGVTAVLLGASNQAVAVSLLGGPVLPVLLVAIGLARVPGTLLAGLVAVALLALVTGLDRVGAPTGHRALALVAGGGATAALLVATAVAIGSGPLAVPVLAEAAVLGVAAAATRRTGPLVAGAVFGLVGLVAALGTDAPVDLVVDFPVSPFVVTAPGGTATAGAVGALVGALATSLLLAAAAVVGLVALARLGLLADRSRAAVAGAGLGVVGLYGATGTVISAALLVSPTRDAFLVGHVLVTVSWTALALVLLVRGLQSSLPRVLGGVLVVSALVKLLLFDLTALDGLARVAAFLGAGLVLLAAGTRYAKAVAAGPEDAATSSASSSTVGPRTNPGRHPEA
ncbi:DUF2339 domain-containing protein [Actinomycetospora chlora]|uniref:DUF2339 domain-containing protein n=1 Tax=Actinomycetospora chlora TaxID=663608 RepID=A0ABP9AJG0_9PSEU